MNSKSIRILFTSDLHGCFTDTDYSNGEKCNRGLNRLASDFVRDGNTLILDGGDTLQGSPMTHFMHRKTEYESLAAKAINIVGYHFVTIGNHDFNYGRKVLEDYISEINATCLSANIKGLNGVERYAVVAMENGLKVGITGITTHYINIWEKPSNIEGITISDAFENARAVLSEMKSEGTDLNICIYHGGFERDPYTGKLLTDTDENQAWRICNELDYDVLLTGHQHNPMENLCVNGTLSCQAPHNAAGYIEMNVCLDESGAVQGSSKVCHTGNDTDEKIDRLFSAAENEINDWLDTPIGNLDVDLIPESHIKMAYRGSLIANFFNQVQLEASGAEISETCLGNEAKGLNRVVTIRNVVSSYIYPNTLKVISANREALKAALERCAEYFETDGEYVHVSEAFTIPKEEHYNFDFFSGIEVMIDISKNVGERVVSIKYKGKEMSDTDTLSLCMNNYRASGTGGYDKYKKCPVLREYQTEIVDLIMDYVERYKNIIVDKKKWMNVTPEYCCK